MRTTALMVDLWFVLERFRGQVQDSGESRQTAVHTAKSSPLATTDKRYRPLLASDPREPVRPVADRIVWGLLREREFSRGAVVETR
jgi:hypothetical protein